MKFISLFTIAACAVLVSAAPHNGNVNSNQEVDITHKTNTEIKDSNIQKTQKIDQNMESDNSYQNNKGLVAGILSGDIARGGILNGASILGGDTRVTNDKNQIASNRNN